jgi:hypothetical protein
VSCKIPVYLVAKIYFVILSEAKDLLSLCTDKKQALRFAQDDKIYVWRELADTLPLQPPNPLRANISETPPVVLINEQGEEEKRRYEGEFFWCCVGGGRGWRGTKRRRA